MSRPGKSRCLSRALELPIGFLVFLAKWWAVACRERWPLTSLQRCVVFFRWQIDAEPQCPLNKTFPLCKEYSEKLRIFAIKQKAWGGDTKDHGHLWLIGRAGWRFPALMRQRRSPQTDPTLCVCTPGLASSRWHSQCTQRSNLRRPSLPQWSFLRFCPAEICLKYVKSNQDSQISLSESKWYTSSGTYKLHPDGHAVSKIRCCSILLQKIVFVIYVTAMVMLGIILAIQELCKFSSWSCMIGSSISSPIDLHVQLSHKWFNQTFCLML